MPKTCEPNPCQNGGNCHDGECSCPVHCKGKRCEKCRGKSISDESNKLLLTFNIDLPHN